MSSVFGVDVAMAGWWTLNRVGYSETANFALQNHLQDVSVGRAVGQNKQLLGAYHTLLFPAYLNTIRIISTELFL